MACIHGVLYDETCYYTVLRVCCTQNAQSLSLCHQTGVMGPGLRGVKTGKNELLCKCYYRVSMEREYKTGLNSKVYRGV